jgi:hypothetical protein
MGEIIYENKDFWLKRRAELRLDNKNPTISVGQSEPGC